MAKIAAMLVLAVLFGGCSGNYMTMQELEADALVTGDWSAVERRQRLMMLRRGGAPACPVGYVANCVDYGTDRRCSCVDQATFRNAMSGGL